MGPFGAQTKILSIQMNVETWNKLPAEYQRIITEESVITREKATKDAINNDERAINIAKNRGQTFNDLTAEQVALWEKFVEPMYGVWVKDTAARGWPAQAALDYVKQLLGK